MCFCGADEACGYRLVGSGCEDKCPEVDDLIAVRVDELEFLTCFEGDEGACASWDWSARHNEKGFVRWQVLVYVVTGNVSVLK